MATSEYMKPGGGINYDAFLSTAKDQQTKISQVGGMDYKLPDNLYSGWMESMTPQQQYLALKQTMPWQQAAQQAGVQTQPKAPGFRIGTGQPSIYGKIPQAPDENQWKAALEGFKADKAVLQGQADKASAAFGVKTAGTMTQLKGIEAAMANVDAQFAQGTALWSVAAGKAKDYVAKGYERMAQITGDLERIFEEMNTGRDFAKAHAMQAGVQSTLGAMEGQGRDIAREFGTDSKEYKQFAETKAQSLGILQSNIHNAYTDRYGLTSI